MPVNLDISALIVVLYFLAMAVIGYIATGRGSSLADFHLASRSLGGLLLVGTLCATIVGASSTIGMAGLGYSNGLPGAWWLLSGTFGLIVLSTLFAERVRASGSFTLPELIGSFYGKRARIAAAVLIVISWIGVIAAQIAASGRVLGQVFGGSEAVYMICATAVFVLYTAHGGQRSVVRTDLIQFTIIIAGIAVLLKGSIDALAASPGAANAVISGLSFPTSSSMGPFEVASMIVIVGSTYLIGPDIYSRLLSARDPGEARRSAVIAAVLLIPLAFAITALGISARALFPSISPEQAIPVLMNQLLSPESRGLVTAALLAAFMSSADTTLLTATSVLTLDIFRPVRPKTSDADLLRISRLASSLIGASALVVAITGPGIIASLMMAYTVFTGGLLVPVLAGYHRERLGLTNRAALVALFGGGATAIVLGRSYPLAGLAVSAALLAGVSLAERILAREPDR